MSQPEIEHLTELQKRLLEKSQEVQYQKGKLRVLAGILGESGKQRGLSICNRLLKQHSETHQDILEVLDNKRDITKEIMCLSSVEYGSEIIDQEFLSVLSRNNENTESLLIELETLTTECEKIINTVEKYAYNQIREETTSGTLNGYADILCEIIVIKIEHTKSASESQKYLKELHDYLDEIDSERGSLQEPVRELN